MSTATYVLDQPAPAATPIPGVAHVTWAGHDDGLQSLSLWRQLLAPGCAVRCTVLPPEARSRVPSSTWAGDRCSRPCPRTGRCRR